MTCKYTFDQKRAAKIDRSTIYLYGGAMRKGPMTYKAGPEGEPWRVVRFYKLSSECSLTKDALPAFHEFAKRQPGWTFFRLYFGIHPVIAPAGSDERFLRVWSITEMALHPELFPPCNSTSVPGRRKFYGRQIETIRILWLRCAERQGRDKQREEWLKTDQVESPPRPELPVDDKTLLRKYGFGPATFGVRERDEGEALAERGWFVNRLREMKRFFDQPSVSILARQSLLSEMYLRRIDARLCLESPGTEAFNDLLGTRLTIGGSYRNAYRQMSDAVPWAGEVANKVRVQGVLSNFIDGIRDAVGHGDTTMLDALASVYEIQVERRPPSQHESLYESEKSVATVEATSGTLNPKLLRNLPPLMRAQFEAGLEEATKRVRESQPAETVAAAGEDPPLVDGNPDSDTVEPAVNIPVQ
jgi:hypothetical protein